MNLLRKLFGKKPQPVIKPQAPAPAPVVKEKPVISLDILETTHDEPSLVNLAIFGETTQLRQAAATKITTRDALEQLVKQLKNKDKNVLKLVKAKLDTFKEADSLQAKIDAQGVILCEKCERHSHHEADAVFKAKLHLIEQEFNAIAESLSDQIKQRFSVAKARCEEKIRAQAEAIALEEEREAADQDARYLAQESLKNLENIAQGIINEEALSEDAIKVARIRIDELSQALRLAKQRDIDLSDIAPTFEKRKEQLSNYLSFIELHGTFAQLAEQLNDAPNDAAKLFAKAVKIFPAEMLSHSSTIVAAQEKIKQFNLSQQQAEEAKQTQQKQVGELIRRGTWAVNNGQVRKARGILRDLTALKETLLTSLPQHLESKWADFENEIEKLGDWHEFAVTPKKHQLIEAMQSLSSSSLEPDTLASRIHELQDEWREVSRGGQQQDDQLWQDFQAASAVAYAPCKEFFEAQAKTRDENLEKRQQLTQTLRTYIEQMNWETANWKDVEQTLKVARNEWQTLWPVPRKAGNEVAKEFEGLMDQLHGKIKAEYDVNKQRKHALVQDARALLTEENLAEATDKIKSLQQDWKSVGRTWHREDQVLWNQFRQASDEVFKKRQSEYELSRKANQEKINTAKTIIKQIEDLAEQLLQSDSKIDEALAELQAQLSALDLTKKDSSPIESAHKQALSKIEDARQARKQRQKNAARESLHTFALTLAELERNALVAGKQDEEQKNAINHQLQELNISATIKQALKARLDNVGSLSPDTTEQSSNALRLLCVRAEILRGEESPTQDKAMRMNYQVELMQQGLGSNRDTLAELEKAWWSTPAVLPQTYQELAHRFFK